MQMSQTKSVMKTVWRNAALLDRVTQRDTTRWTPETRRQKERSLLPSPGRSQNASPRKSLRIGELHPR